MTMNRHARRKAKRAKRAKRGKFVRLSNGLKVKVTETVNLSDPNLSPEHRDTFVAVVKGRVAELDELIANWYRQRDRCGIEGCDCGEGDLAEAACTVCSHLYFIKQRFGETLIDRYPHFDRFLREGLTPDDYESLAPHATQ